jgi:hypothetical protein
MNTPSPIAGMRPTVLTRIPYRGWESQIALPMQHDLDSLSSKDMVQGGTVGVGATAYGSMTQEEDCWITHITGSSINPSAPASTGTFSVQFYDSERQKLWHPQPFFFQNVGGSAQQPFFLRRLYLLPSQGELKCSIVNLATFAAEIQVVLWGLRKDFWKVNQ